MNNNGLPVPKSWNPIAPLKSPNLESSTAALAIDVVEIGI